MAVLFELGAISARIKRMKRLEKPNWQKQNERKKTLWIGLIGALLLIPVLGSAVYLLDKIRPLESFAEESGNAQGRRIVVPAGGDFQNALNQSNPGDTIVLKAGAIYKGAFKLPKKRGEQFVTVTTSAAQSLPSPDKRIDPDKHSSLLPKLESNVKGKPVILTADGAHHFRFIGVEFKPTIEGLYNIIQIGSSEETSVDQLPHNIEFDRVYIRGSKVHGQRRGIAANGRHIKIINSHISEIKRDGEETQAIAIWSADGPLEIRNNYLEAAGIGILFGGAGAPLKLIPTDCIVKDNHINKPLEWKEQAWDVKNMFEIKNGRNIKVQNNLMTNNWASAQSGTAVLFTTRADNKNVVIENIEFSNNIIQSSGNALNIYGSEGDGGRNLTIKNNLFADIDGSRWGGAGHFLLVSDWDGLTIENNTIIQTGNMSNAHGPPTKDFIFRNNIIYNNEYGFFGDGSSPGRVALNEYFPGFIVTNNIIIGGDSKDYGRSNFYPSSIRQIGFIDRKHYRLGKNNPYRSRGFGGKQIGADIDPASVGGN